MRRALHRSVEGSGVSVVEKVVAGLSQPAGVAGVVVVVIMPSPLPPSPFHASSVELGSRSA